MAKTEVNGGDVSSAYSSIKGFTVRITRDTISALDLAMFCDCCWIDIFAGKCQSDAEFVWKMRNFVGNNLKLPMYGTRQALLCNTAIRSLSW